MRYISEILRILTDYLRRESTHHLVHEIEERKRFFDLLVLGTLFGLPVPVTYVAFKLMPYLLDEINKTSRIKGPDDFINIFDLG